MGAGPANGFDDGRAACASVANGLLLEVSANGLLLRRCWAPLLAAVGVLEGASKAGLGAEGAEGAGLRTFTDAFDAADACG